MSLFHTILSELTKKLSNEEEKKDIIAQEITEVLHIPINKDELFLSKKGLFLNVSPTKKAALYLKKEAIKDILSKHNLLLLSDRK